jgi:hypothetical protein
VLHPRQTFASLIPWLLARYSAEGFPVELETLRNLKNAESDPVRMEKSLMLVRPRYLNFFGDFIGVVNALEKRGDPRTYQASWDEFAKVMKQSGKDPQVKARQAAELFAVIRQHRLPSPVD